MYRSIIFCTLITLFLIALPVDAMKMDGNFGDWEDIQSVNTDSVDIAENIQYWDSSAWTETDPGNADYYTDLDAMLDIVDFKIYEDGSSKNIFFYLETAFPIYSAYLPATQDYLPYGMKSGLYDISSAPEDFDNYYVFSFDEDNDGIWDYYLTFNVTYDEGASILTGEPVGIVTLYRNANDNEFNKSNDGLFDDYSTASESSAYFQPDLSGTSNKIEFKVKKADFFFDTSMFYEDKVTVRAETHRQVYFFTEVGGEVNWGSYSELVDTTNAGNYTYSIEDVPPESAPKIKKVSKKKGIILKKKKPNATYYKARIIKNRSKNKVFAIKRFTKKKNAFTKKQKRKLKKDKRYICKVKSCNDYGCSEYWSSEVFQVKK